MSIYEKSVRLLFRDMIKDLNIQKGDILTREQVLSWFNKNYPKIKNTTVYAHLILLSTNKTSRIHYNPHSNGQDDLFFQIDSNRFRLYDPETDTKPIYKSEDIQTEPEAPEPDDESMEVNEFAYEKDLQNFLSKNLELIENGLRLYEEEGITGVEFPVGNRFIDILALDRNGDYVVIELKVSRGYDRVVGQLLRYIAWIRQHQAETGQKVRGVIIAREISDDLMLACSEIPNIDLYEYQLSVSLKKLNQQ